MDDYFYQNADKLRKMMNKRENPPRGKRLTYRILYDVPL